MIDDATLDRWLADDVPLGDLTTFALGIGPLGGRMIFTARDPMILAGAEEAGRLLQRAGATLAGPATPSGRRLAQGDAILTATGSAEALHRGWKVAQTLIEAASGMATAARRIVDAARAVRPTIAVACTRKTLPGAKALSIRAIMAGGAVPHRLGLSETLLVFDQHRRFLPDLTPAQIIDRLRTATPERKIVVEITEAEEAQAWAEAGVDVLQADKMSPGTLAAMIAGLGPRRPLVAAAGGVNADNAAAYAQAGADLLVTSSPYLAKPLDVQVVLGPTRP